MVGDAGEQSAAQRGSASRSSAPASSSSCSPRGVRSENWGAAKWTAKRGSFMMRCSVLARRHTRARLRFGSRGIVLERKRDARRAIPAHCLRGATRRRGVSLSARAIESAQARSRSGARSFQSHETIEHAPSICRGECRGRDPQPRSRQLAARRGWQDADLAGAVLSIRRI